MANDMATLSGLDALVTYLADLAASSGAAPDVVFDGRIGAEDEQLPASRAVRIRRILARTGRCQR